MNWRCCLFGGINKGFLRAGDLNRGRYLSERPGKVISGLPDRPTGQTNPLKQYSREKEFNSGSSVYRTCVV